jgi:Protein kinase domain
MTISPTEFWKRIAEYHLATAQDSRLWAAEIAEVAGPQAIGDVDQIVDCLMRTGKLTAFQANALLLDVPERLSIGPYVIQEPIDEHPFQSWKVATNSLTKQTAWLFLIDGAFLSDPLWSSYPPSIALCRKHARLHSTGLQFIAEPVAFGDAIALSTPVLTGASLAHSLHGTSMPWQQTIAFIQSVTRALRSMHEATLIHGSIQLDRVWHTEQGEIILLRDPLFPPRSPLAEPHIGCWDAAANASCYAAPEFLVPGQNPTVQTDLYALGCLWYQLLTGHAPFTDIAPSGRMEAHASRVILLSEIIQIPLPLQQCLMHLIAKNPKARFATAKQFESALGQALRDIQFDPAQAPIAPPMVARNSKPTAGTSELPPSPIAPPPTAATVADKIKPTESATKPKAVEVRDAPVAKPVEPKKAPEPIKQADATKVTGKPTDRAASEPATPNASTAKAAATAKPASPTSPAPTTAAPPTAAASPAAIATSAPGPVPKPTSVPTVQEPNSSSPPKASEATRPDRKEDPKPQPVKQSVPAPATISPSRVPETKPAAKPNAKPETPEPAPVPTATPSAPVDPAVKNEPATASSKPTASSSPKNPDTAKPKSDSSAAAAPPPKDPAVTTQKTFTPPTPPIASPAAPTAPVVPTSPIAPTPPEPSTDPVAASSPPSATAPKPTPTPQPIASVSTAAKSPPAKKSKRGKRKPKRPVWFIPALFGGAAVILIGLIVVFLQKPKQPNSTETKSQEVVSSTPNGSGDSTKASDVPPQTSNPLEEQFIVQDDDGSLPWIPPHASQPFSIDMIPPGAQGFIFVRPEAWLESPEGLAIVDVLETDLGPLWKDLESIAGVAPSQIRSVAISLFPGESGWPSFAYRIDLKEKLTLSELRELWKKPEEEPLDSKNSILVSGERAYYIAKQPLVDATSIETFAVGPKPIIRELAELKGAVAPQRKQIEEIFRATDSKSDLTIVIAPSFLFTDATQVLSTYAPTIASELEKLVGTKMRAGLFTTTLAPQWYVEFRLMGESEQNAGQLVVDLKKAFSEMADKVEASFVQSPPHPHWRAIAARFPQMLRSLQKHQRYGVENGQSISNFYLPSTAAPNLTLASWMAIQQPMAASTTSTTASNTPKPLTPEQMLDRPITIAFDQESLEVALQSISEEANRDLPAGTKPLAMEIVSAALERDGITRNQQIKEFKHKQQPLRAVLLDLVLRANPIRTVKVPTEADQKLVWILTDDPKNAGNKLIQITTRRATTDAKITLPTEFVPK